MGEEGSVDRRWEQDVERADDIGRREPGRGEARFPEWHVPAVDRDDDRVRERSHEGDRQARLAAVDPQPDQEDRVGRDQQWDPEGLCGRNTP